MPEPTLYSPVYNQIAEGTEKTLCQKYITNLKTLFVECIPCQVVLVVLVISILFELKKYICGENKSSCLKIFKKLITTIIGVFITIALFQFNSTVSWSWVVIIMLFVIFSNVNTVCNCIKAFMT